MPYCETKNPVKLKRCKTLSSYKVYNLMKLKPQKERQFQSLEYGYVTWKPAIDMEKDICLEIIWFAATAPVKPSFLELILKHY